METKKILGLIGSLVLFVGVFAPVVSIPILGSMNYFQNGKGDGVVILILAVISLILTVMKKYWGLWFTGLGACGVMVFTFVNFQLKMAELQTQIENELIAVMIAGRSAPSRVSLSAR